MNMARISERDFIKGIRARNEADNRRMEELMVSAEMNAAAVISYATALQNDLEAVRRIHEANRRDIGDLIERREQTDDSGTN